MKRIIYLLSIALAMNFVVACEDQHDIIDYVPIVLKVHIQDTAGNNLLDANVPNNILDKNIHIVYDDKVLPVFDFEHYTDSLQAEAKSRVLLAEWFGSFISKTDSFCKDPLEYGPMLFVGEFAGDKDGIESVTLFIGDKSYELKFSNRIDGLKVKRHYYLDDVEQSDNNFYIKL